MQELKILKEKIEKMREKSSALLHYENITKIKELLLKHEIDPDVYLTEKESNMINVIYSLELIKKIEMAMAKE